MTKMGQGTQANREQAALIMSFAKDNNRSASYYLFGPNLSLQDQLDVDGIVSYLSSVAEKEKMDKMKEEDNGSTSNYNH